MQAIANQIYTLEEYFELDKNADGNFEYFDGEIFEMSGVSPNHARIEMNLAIMFGQRANKKGCEAFPSNLRVKVPMLPTYRYPDLTIACGKAEFVEIGGLQCLVNPNLIVEVLSDSTERYDQNEKFRQYKSIESFSEYLLISSTEKVVLLYQKHNGRFWLRSDYESGESFNLKTLDFDFDVDDLYQGVEIEEIVETKE